MTRRVLLCWILGVALFCIGIAYKLWLWIQPIDNHMGERATAAAAIAAVFVVGPAALLAFCFQQRTSYLQQLRTLWSKSIEAGQAAILATGDGKDNVEAVNAARAKVSTTIDEVRGVFKRIGPGSKYPYEPIKDIHEELGLYLEFPGQREQTHKRILDLWKLYRNELLKEFDAAAPTSYVTDEHPKRKEIIKARNASLPGELRLRQSPRGAAGRGARASRVSDDV